MDNRRSRDREFFRRLVDSMPEAVLVAYPEGRLVYANATSERLFGYAPGGLNNADIRLLLPNWESVAPKLRRDTKPASGLRVRSRDVTGRKKNGTPLPLALRANPISSAEETLVLTLRDITVRKQAEIKFRQTAALLKQIIHTAGDAVVLVDDAQRVILFNRSAEQIFGYRAAEIIGRPLQELIPERFRAAHPGQVTRFGNHRNTARLMGERGKIAGLRRSGEEFPAEAAISHIVADGKRTFAVILRDITERERAEARLQHTMRRAEQANLAKSRFLANMNHELRTPLNAVIGFSEIIAAETFGPIDPPQYRDYIADIHASGLRLLELVTNILDMARVEAEDFELRDTDLDIVEILDSCAEAARDRLVGRGLRLRISVSDKARWLRADSAMIRSIVSNLLSNACKFTGEGGTVTISTDLDLDRSFVLTVADTGIGMAAADIPSIFEPFGQVDASITRRYQGAGLGLTLTRALVELHGGTLRIESILEAGTAVTIRFPPMRSLTAPRKPASAE